MVLEKDSDLESMRKSRMYNGKYFVLGGLVSIVEKSTPTRVRINELIQTISKNKNLKEMNDLFGLTNSDELNEWFKNIQF
jgi:recombinational DNA repair protein RecR